MGAGPRASAGGRSFSCVLEKSLSLLAFYFFILRRGILEDAYEIVLPVKMLQEMRSPNRKIFIECLSSPASPNPSAQLHTLVATILAIFHLCFLGFSYTHQDNMLKLLFPNLPTLASIYCLPVGISKELAALQPHPAKGIWFTIFR